MNFKKLYFFLFLSLPLFNCYTKNSNYKKSKNKKQKSSTIKKLIKYEFLYKKLTADPPKSFLSTKPAIIAISTISSLIISNLLRILLDYNQPQNCPHQTSGKIFILVGATFYKALSELLINSQNSQKQILINIVKNWEFYKFLTPKEFHDQFESLHNQYKINKNKLTINEQKSEEIIISILLNIMNYREKHVKY